MSTIGLAMRAVVRENSRAVNPMPPSHGCAQGASYTVTRVCSAQKSHTISRSSVRAGSSRSILRVFLVIIRINIFREIVTDRGFSRANGAVRSSHEPRGGPCQQVLVVEPVSLFGCVREVRDGRRSGFWANVISKKR